MTEEVTPVVIKKTQDTLGKVIKKPPLHDKLLKKPPFRFLHDIITNVIKTSGFLKGLYTDEEMVSDNVKDKESKINFLQKTIDVVVMVTGEPLSVRPSKIVAGHEADKTNELLQALGKAVIDKMDSSEAVDRVLKGEKPAKSSSSKKKSAESSSEKRKEKEVVHSPVYRNGYVSSGKREKETKATKSSERISKSSPKKSLDSTRRESHVRESGKDSSRNKDTDKHKDRVRDKEKSKERVKSSKSEDHKSNSRASARSGRESSRGSHDRRSAAVSGRSRGKTLSITEEEDKENGPSLEHEVEEEAAEIMDLNMESNIPDIDKESGPLADATPAVFEDQDRLLDDHLTGQGFEELNQLDTGAVEAVSSAIISRPPSTRPTTGRSRSHTGSAKPKMNVPPSESGTSMEEVRSSSDATDGPPPSARSSLRSALKSARPPSARPAPPKVRNRDIIQAEEQMRLASAKPVTNVIVDSESKSDDEDEAFVIEESGPLEPELKPELLAPKDPIEDEQQGSLVKQLLETKKDLEGGSQQLTTRRVEIDKSQMIDTAHGKKEKEVMAREVEKLREFIQTVSRSANPLGKMLDYLQEDVDAMQQELKMWQDENQKNLVALRREQSITETALEPLQAQLEEVEQGLQDQLASISTLKATILRNDERIGRMMASVNLPQKV
ncbi:intraflagellar transport 54 [Tachypleus tridentatus]|uniref:intraflagellar transport 54 n=1 Tax=Tachypleus tridentatus TaxID=6853 RepID=UPI003FCFC2CD